MAGDYKIQPELMQTLCKLQTDLGTILENYENGDISAEGLYDFALALHVELNDIIFND